MVQRMELVCLLVIPQKDKKKRLQQVLKILKKLYPEVFCALHYKNPYELAVSTILSAQCTDERVNLTTPALFRRYPTADKLARAKIADVEKLVYSTGFYKNKARNLIKLGKVLVAQHGGTIPNNLTALEKLPGIGRKTANVVLGNAFGIASGIAVDTHVTRIMNLLGIVDSKNALIIERELKSLVPQKEWINFTHYIITHGREVCIARRPQCGRCALKSLCPSCQI